MRKLRLGGLGSSPAGLGSPRVCAPATGPADPHAAVPVAVPRSRAPVVIRILGRATPRTSGPAAPRTRRLAVPQTPGTAAPQTSKDVPSLRPRALTPLRPQAPRPLRHKDSPPFEPNTPATLSPARPRRSPCCPEEPAMAGNPCPTAAATDTSQNLMQSPPRKSRRAPGPSSGTRLVARQPPAAQDIAGLEHAGSCSSTPALWSIARQSVRCPCWE